MSRRFLAILLAVLLLAATETVSLASPTVNMSARINPLVLKVRAPRRVHRGDVFEIRARVLNISKRTLRYARVSLILPNRMALVATSVRQDLGRISAGGVKVASWQVVAKRRGRKVVKVKAAARFNKTSPLFTAVKARTIRVRRRSLALSAFETVRQLFLAANTRIKNLIFP